MMSTEKQDKPLAITISSILNAFSEPMIALDSSYQVLAANRSYMTLYPSGKVSDIAGKKCHELSHGYSVPCDQMGENCPLSAVLADHGAHRVTHVHQSPTGPHVVEVELWPGVDPVSQEVFYLEKIHPSPLDSRSASHEGLVGHSPMFLQMLSLIHKVASKNTLVFLEGETGTGKELVAHAIHQFSPRREKPFVTVDCSGLTETLIESELFGHEKGAFTGAQGKKIGLVEAARGGTLFLDEVGELPLSMQVKLLRLLETNIFRRVGGVDPIKADIRLISATHRNLRRMVEEGGFRKDLFYRLNIFPIRLPALRDRKGDIPLLIDSVMKRFSDHPVLIDEDARSLLLGHSYPGNIRELRNILERALILSDGETITPDHLPDLQESLPEISSWEESKQLLSLREAEGRYLDWVLSRSEEPLSDLALKLGVSPRTLYRKMDKKRKRGSHRV